MALASLQLTNQMFTFQIFVQCLNEILSNRTSYELVHKRDFICIIPLSWCCQTICLFDEATRRQVESKTVLVNIVEQDIWSRDQNVGERSPEPSPGCRRSQTDFLFFNRSLNYRKQPRLKYANVCSSGILWLAVLCPFPNLSQSLFL